MIDQDEIVRVVDKLRGDAVVVPSMRAVIGWERTIGDMNRVIPLDSAYIPSAMGKASSFALGLCLARPDTKVIVLDGDGSLLMNLGTLVTVANKAPRNLYHFVMDNGVYATTGGQRVPGAGQASFVGMAREAGYARTYQFEDLEEFTTQAQQILDEPGPTLICLKTVPDVRLSQERAVPRVPRPVPSQVVREAQRQLGTGG